MKAQDAHSFETGIQSTATQSNSAIKIPPMKHVAILGAGVMGAQIAAHFANAGIPALLFDLPADGDDASATARSAIKALAKQKPEPLALARFATLITACNYADDLEKLSQCDLVIEAIAERIEWKTDLYHKIAPYLHDHAILASNTSGISIGKLAESLLEPHRQRFLGIHFFNPPRYMPLVEIIAHDATSSEMMDRIETFLVSTLGKGIVRANDTVNFVANRVGVFSILITLYHAERLGLNFETVDELTGTRLGRPKSATLRTADIVGLDTLKHVIQGVVDNLKDDPWASLFKVPDWLEALVSHGSLGQKTRIGVYKKEGKEILVYEPSNGTYRKRKVKIPGKVEKLLRQYKDPDRLAKLKQINKPHAEFLWAIHRDVLHYCAHLLDQIADNSRDVDMAIRWGFGWKQGPFEIWQQAGWNKIAGLISEDIAAGKTPCPLPLPDWVNQIEAAHTAQGSWSARDKTYKPASTLPVYTRQRWPQTVFGESQPEHSSVFENDAAHFWLVENDIGVLSFKTKMHTISDPVLASLNEAVDYAERHLTGMIIWHPDEPFSAGADLKSFMPVAMKSLLPGNNSLDELLQRFQNTCIRMRKSTIPVVAGVHGLALGGGCELMMQCDRVVAALESYVGLVEVGVGLIPAGSGCMEFARRASQAATEHANTGTQLFDQLKNAFEVVGMGKVATSAYQARELGFLRDCDVIVMNRHEVLDAAVAQIRALHAANYRQQPDLPIRAGGRAAIANLKAAMANLHAGEFISDYDMKIGGLVADAICGGDVDECSELPESWFLNYERKGFRSLLKNTKTHLRVKHMLDTGKPLRN